MSKIARIIVWIVVAGVLLIIGLFIAPVLYDVFRSANQKRALQGRTDYPQIAAACVTIARGVTSDSVPLKPSDPLVPSLLRSLSPTYIDAHTNNITLEFHGGFDHYGYRVQQLDADPRRWTISVYTEQGQKLLTTITND